MRNTSVGISVIIPCCGYERFMDSAINSVLMVHDVPYEIIVVLYGSSVHSTISYENSPNIRIVKSSTQSVQCARCLGIKKAKFPYIMTLDADDRLADTVGKSYLYQIVDNLTSDPNVAIVTGISRVFPRRKGQGITSASYPINELDIVLKSHIKTSIGVRREDALGGYHSDVVKWQDWDFAISVLNSRYLKHKPNHIIFINRIVHEYRIGKNNGISHLKVNEYEMVKRTVIHSYPLFQKYLDGNVNQISAFVLHSKPSIFEDFVSTERFNQKNGLLFIKSQDAVLQLIMCLRKDNKVLEPHYNSLHLIGGLQR